MEPTHTSTRTTKTNTRKTSCTDIYDQILYVGVSGLCLMMVLWILVFPATWRAGWKWHDDQTQDFYTEAIKTTGQYPTPLSLTTKYKGHKIAQFCHILPGCIWSGLIPFQLHPQSRKKYRKQHRYSGYLFTAVAYLMMVGYIYIDVKGLIYIHSDFPNLAIDQHTTHFPVHVPHEPVFRMVGVWFLITISMAVYCAMQNKFQEHRKWILRHVASGIWVAVQRIIVIVMNSKEAKDQKKTFGDGAVVGVMLTVVLAEISIYGMVGKKRKRL